MSTLDANNRVTLEVGSTRYGGWKSVRITPGIERQARDFDLEVTDRWPGQTDIPRRVQPGDPCRVWIGPDLVLTGYVDATPIRFDGHSVSVSVRGRSKTADLVDCSPFQAGVEIGEQKQDWKDVVPLKAPATKPQPRPAKTAAQWRNVKMEAIAAALAAPYGVRVLAETDTGRVIPEHQVQVGESVFESIDRMMRQRHVLSTDNEFGDLVFIDVGSDTADTPLKVGSGGNVREGETELDYKGVFSEYVVLGQRKGNDADFGAAVAEEDGEDTDYEPETVLGEKATATDARAKRRRLLVIKQGGMADEGTVQDRAEYERAYRAAKALQTTYTVQGWRQESGALWKPNMLVRVHDAIIGFDTEMVIASLSWILDEQGMRTQITVGPPDGYRTKAGKLKKSKRQAGGGPDWSDVK